MSAKQICIIGGGVIGLVNAWYLARSGYRVTLIDQGDITDNTSFGNAGLLSAFEKDPLSHPGVISSTLKLMLKGQSPLKFHPSLDPQLYRWLLAFTRNATAERLRKTLIVFERYGMMAMGGYERLASEGVDFEWHRDGLMLVFTEKSSYEAKLRELGDNPHYRILTGEEIRRYLPLAQPERLAGVLLLTRDAHLDPGSLMRGLKTSLEQEGVTIHTQETIERFEHAQGRIIAAHSRTHRYEADSFILATGADSSLAESLGRSLMMIPAKGYSITFGMDEALKPRTSALFYDIFTALTPRDHDVRITSKLELGVADTIPHKKQIQSILKTFREFTIDFVMQNLRPWAGNRPLTPNDMPLIGRDETYDNLIYATGLGWLGITFAPAIGQIIHDLIHHEQANKDNMDILLFSGFYQGC
jgi:D-amino-acid dehydrogenase